MIQDASIPNQITKKRMVKRKKDGSEFVTDTTIIPLFDGNGEIIEYTLLRDDVTKEVKYECEILQKQKQEEIRKKVEKAKETFLLVFTHELKTPLNAIIHFSKYIKNKIQKLEISDQEKLLKLSDIVLNNATDMLANVTQILEISKLTSHKLVYTYNKFNINELLKNILSRYEGILLEQNINVLYSPEDEIYITSDMYRVEQIISNIISNAIKYGKGKIIITLNKKKKRFLRSKEDNGSGIKDKDGVFNLFTQEDENLQNRKGKGTGIGLHFVKLICEDLKIYYTLQDSKRLGGCEFNFLFYKKNKPMEEIKC